MARGARRVSGSIASVYQQSGGGTRRRACVICAGCNGESARSILAHHPDYFFGQSPEQGLVNPDHLLILLNHLRCAMFELPFQKAKASVRWMQRMLKNSSTFLHRTMKRISRRKNIFGCRIRIPRKRFASNRIAGEYYFAND